jgi:chromosomal replication initiation ATPase DnaA
MAYDISAWNKPAGPASNDELDRRAMRRMPDWAKDVVREVSLRHDVPIRAIIGKSQSKVIVAARREAIYRVKFEKPSVSSAQLGHWFDRDHSTILFALVRYQELYDAPVLSMKRSSAEARRAA